MSKVVSVSVITLTKDRAPFLEKCLASLKGQLDATDEIIIVDNDSKDNTQLVIDKFKKKLPIRVYKSRLHGYPKLYNFAILKSTNPLLVFFDDDCVATHNFMDTIRKSYRLKQGFVLQGKTLSVPRNNIFAEISEHHLTNWITSNMIAPNRLRIIDNRNVAIPAVFFRRYGMFSLSCELGSEDVELGLRYQRHGVPIVFNPGLTSFHHEKTTLGSFLAQHNRIAKSHGVLDLELPQDEKQHSINRRTIKLHFMTSSNLFRKYIQTGRLVDALKLPLVYALLFVVRIVGYAQGSRVRQYERL